MSDAETVKENPNKRRAIDSIENRSEMDMETLKGFMIDQNDNLQDNQQRLEGDHRKQ